MNIIRYDETQDSLLDTSLELSIRGDLKSSEKILRSLNQNDPRVRFNLGWFDMRNGKLLEGYKGLDAGRTINVFGSNKFPRTTPVYDGESLKNKTLLFIGEGGFGDEIINVRFTKNFYDMGAKVILGCSSALYPIFKNIDYLNGLVERDVCDQTFHDYWVPAMSAAKYLNLEYETLNGSEYLNFFEPRKFKLKKNKLKVGLKWAGNPKFEHQQHRKFPFEKMIELSKMENVQAYSLQRDEDLMYDSSFVDLRYELKTWKDTAEIIAGLDLIITSCTSIAHLSGAMGKPTWVIVPLLSYYTWAIPGNKSPWYKSVTLYRQTKYGSWDEPFEKIKSDLSNLRGF